MASRQPPAATAPRHAALSCLRLGAAAPALAQPRSCRSCLRAPCGRAGLAAAAAALALIAPARSRAVACRRWVGPFAGPTPTNKPRDCVPMPAAAAAAAAATPGTCLRQQGFCQANWKFRAGVNLLHRHGCSWALSSSEKCAPPPSPATKWQRGHRADAGSFWAVFCTPCVTHPIEAAGCQQPPRYRSTLPDHEDASRPSLLFPLL